MSAAAAEPGRFTDGVEPTDGVSGRVEGVAVEVGLYAAEGLARDDVQFCCDQGP